MTRFAKRCVGVAVLLASAALVRAQPEAGVHGRVLDRAGVPQMGVTVELVGTDARVVAAAFTGLDGRYVLRHLVPGVYQLRATATLYLPAMRSRLRLRAGDLPTIDVTLRGLLDQAWLPASGRRAEDQADDWQWTLRSSANRPLLRVLDDDGAVASDAAPERARVRPEVRRRVAVEGKSGQFGGSGLKTVVERRATRPSRSDASLIRVALLQQGPGTAGIDATAAFASEQSGVPARRIALRLRTLPRVSLDGSGAGTTVLDVLGGERVVLGDFGAVEAGSLLRLVHSGEGMAVSYPFVRGEIYPAEGWTVGYGLATTAECQGLDDVGRSSAEAPAAGLVAGRLQLERGVHQVIFARRRAGKLLVEASLVRDDLRSVSVAGREEVRATQSSTTLPLRSASEMRLVDDANGVFHQLHPGYSSNTWRVTVSYPVLPATELTAEYAAGEALAARRTAAKQGMSNVLGAERGQVARAVLQTTVRRSGTRVRVGYAWQPEMLVTAIDPFAENRDGQYLSVHMQQALPAGHLLPSGTVLRFDGENLAREGYVTASNADPGATMLASTLRTLQAGLAFTF